MPGVDTMAVDVAEWAALKVVVPGPDACVQVPVPVVGVLPPSDALVREAQIFWLTPAVAGVGSA